MGVRDSFDELDAALAGPEPDWDSEPEAPPDAEQADRMLVRLRMLRRERDADLAAAETRISQIVAWQAEREGRYDAQERWLVEALERYHRAVLALDPRSLTIHLPSGTLPSRMGQPQWEVDGEAVLRWLIPETAREKIDALRRLYVTEAHAVLFNEVGVEPGTVRLPVPDGPTLALREFKAWATRRDDEDRPVAWGVSPSEEPIPGVSVQPPERDFPPPRLHGTGDDVERFDTEMEETA